MVSKYRLKAGLRFNPVDIALVSSQHICNLEGNTHFGAVMAPCSVDTCELREPFPFNVARACVSSGKVLET